MKQTINSLFDRLLSGKITLDEVLWMLLCGGLLFASIHLLTMLVTDGVLRLVHPGKPPNKAARYTYVGDRD